MIVPELRKGRIGSSQIGALAGLSAWKTPLDVFLELTGRSTFTGNSATAWGHAMEDPIASQYAKRFNVTLEEGTTLVLPGRPWACATPDRLIVGQDKGVEIKNVGWRQRARWGDEGSDEAPEDYVAQCVWEMAATGRSSWDLVAYFGGDDMRVYPQKRDLELEAALVEVGERFVREHLAPDKAPEVDGSDTAREWLAKRFPRAGEKLLESTPNTDALALELRDARRTLEAAEERKALLENKLKECIGEAAGLKGAWGQVRWGSRKGSTKTSWEAVARALQASDELIKQHTTTGAPSRFFTVKFAEEN